MTASKDPLTVAIELLRDDAHAASFQSLGQYRSALLNALSAQSTASPDPVVEANREMLLQRSLVGLKKYRVTLADGGLSLRERLHHALEEALDLSNYMQAAISAIDAGALTAPRAAADGEREAHDRWFYAEYPAATSIPKGEYRMSLEGWKARAALSQPAKEQEPEGLTSKQAWWAGYRAGKGLPPDTPRQEAVAAPVQAEAKPDFSKYVTLEAYQQAMRNWLEQAEAQSKDGQSEGGRG